ncbi:MAG: serine/threonine-protein phosphatase, partial [Lachnospiraceae bacterium]|nr:serine/threonine-protein phosphatase [Lachnospiraceae bacterium]
MNQDFVFSSETPVGNLPNLFIVADGMGGHNGGGFASSYAVEIIKNDIEASREHEPEALFKSAVRAANRAVREKAAGNSDLVGMGTTVVMAVIEDDILHVCNVGDSRLYVCSTDNIRQITVDHSYVEEMIRVGQLDRESARTHEHKNIITRAVGADE